MRRLSVIVFSIISISCSKQGSDYQVNNSDTLSTDKEVITIQPEIGEDYLISTYDDPTNNLDQHASSLKELSDNSVFETIHDSLVLTLDKEHQDYFNSNSRYRLINSSSGDLFQNVKEDYCFIVYDNKLTRVSILLYDGLQNNYFELFRDINVKNGLKNVDCNYGAYGTLDYQLADELIYQREYLIKNPLMQIGNLNCKITDLSKDEDFVLESGCFAKGYSAVQRSNSLCIPTSSVYNNWECLTYNKTKKEFVIFYGQAFAD